VNPYSLAITVAGGTRSFVSKGFVDRFKMLGLNISYLAAKNQSANDL